MQLVDRVTSAGYSYVSPTVDKACNVVPLLGGVKQRIEPYAPPLVQKADMCIDMVYNVAEGRVAALRSIVTSTGDKVLDLKMTASCKAQSFIDESFIASRVHKTSLALVDTLDMLIDRYLPEPLDGSGSKDDVDDAAKIKASDALIPRIMYLPFKIPARMVYITVVKMQNGCDVLRVNITWAIRLTSDQKAKLKGLILSRSRAIVDRASSSSLAVGLQQGKRGASKKLQVALESLAAGKKAVGVKCYIVCERLHVIEVKDATLKNVGLFHQSATDRASGILMAASQRAYDVTAYIAGQERATGIFQTIGTRLPIVKAAIRSSASTGSLSDASSSEACREAEQDVLYLASSTGTTTKESASPSAMLVQEEDDFENDEKSFRDADSVGDVDSIGYQDAQGYVSA